MSKTNYTVLIIAMIILLNLAHSGTKAEAAGVLPSIYPTYDIDYDDTGTYNMDFMQVGYDLGYGIQDWRGTTKQLARLF